MKISQLSVQIDAEKPADIYFFAHTGKVAPDGLLRLGMEEERTGWISSAFVSEDARGKGIGTALINAAIEACRASGRRFVSLAVANKNEGAQRLYKKLGFEEFMTGQEGYMQYVKTL